MFRRIHNCHIELHCAPTLRIENNGTLMSFLISSTSCEPSSDVFFYEILHFGRDCLNWEWYCFKKDPRKTFRNFPDLMIKFCGFCKLPSFPYEMQKVTTLCWSTRSASHTKHGRLGLQCILVRVILVMFLRPKTAVLEAYHTSASRTAVRLEFHHVVKFYTYSCLYTSAMRCSMTNIGFSIYSVTLQPQGIWEESSVAATPNYPKLVILH